MGRRQWSILRNEPNLAPASEAYAWAFAIAFKQNHTGSFKRTSYGGEIRGNWAVFLGLEAGNCSKADPGFVSQLRLGDAQ